MLYEDMTTMEGDRRDTLARRASFVGSLDKVTARNRCLRAQRQTQALQTHIEVAHAAAAGSDTRARRAARSLAEVGAAYCRTCQRRLFAARVEWHRRCRRLLLTRAHSS